MKVWTVTSCESNESLDCEVYATEQEALAGYLRAMGLGDSKRWKKLVDLYWNDINTFEEKIMDYLDDNYPGNMYRLYEHEIELSTEEASK